MKILNVEVYDARRGGILMRPVIEVRIDEPLYPGSDAVTYTRAGVEWETQKYGPFVRYSVTPKSRMNAGNYNIAFRDLFPPIVDVQIDIGDLSDRMPGHFGLPLKRARQLLRQFDVPYRLLMNDHDGQHGLLEWTPVHKHPTCHYQIEGVGGPNFDCRRDAVQTVNVKGIDLTLCAEHLAEHNSNQRASRHARIASR